MNNHLTLDERIKKLEDKIADARDYISSDFCKQCMSTYKEIHFLEEELKKLYDSKNQ